MWTVVINILPQMIKRQANTQMIHNLQIHCKVAINSVIYVYINQYYNLCKLCENVYLSNVTQETVPTRPLAKCQDHHSSDDIQYNSTPSRVILLLYNSSTNSV